MLGQQRSGQATPPAGTFTAVSAGKRPHLRREDERNARLLGRNDFGQATPPSGTFTAVSGGGRPHLRDEDERHASRAGAVTTPARSTPPAGIFTSVSAGGDHTCGMKADGTVVCWGKNTSGEATPPAGFG